jgi:UDP-glucuronate 4-epimerase
MRILVTGGAGFIGFHTLKRLKAEGHDVFGVDSYNNYYDPKLKHDRTHELSELDIPVYWGDLFSSADTDRIIFEMKPEMVIHLAAYAGVRYSLEYPLKYINNNIAGTNNLIKSCEKHGVDRVIYASTSCVMAGNPLPWKEDEKLGTPLSPYGYSKIANESQFSMSKLQMAVGLRFFTVYGPWGRPDMALFSFCDKIVKGEPIQLYNYGNMKRDFTYVDDIVDGIVKVMNYHIPHAHRVRQIYNIGNGQQVELKDFVEAIEKNLGRKAVKELVAAHPADVDETWSDTSKIQAIGYKPTTSIQDGVAKFVEWYKHYYGVN